jgi:hypothetical protein
METRIKTGDTMRKLMCGALSGLIATAPMSVVIALGRAGRLLWTPPPRQITSSAASKVGIEEDRNSNEFTATWIGAHFAYGAVCGAVYSLVRSFIPGSTAVRGLVFGEFVWSVSYLGYIPALGLYPWPKDDSKSRMAVMITAHAVFGVATAQFKKALERIDEDSDCYVTLQPPVGLTHQRA